MGSILGESLKRLMWAKRRKNRMSAVLLVLSVVVSLNVFFMLRQPGLTLADNRETMTLAVDKAGAEQPDIIVLGECMYDRGVDLPLPEKTETDKGSMCTLMRQKAAQYHCWLIYNFHEYDNGEYYNTSILFDREGNTAGKYRKTHLTVTELEAGMTPGVGYPVFDTDFGRIGMLICWDHYFSATTEALAAKGAEILFVSSAGDAAEQCIARAKDAGLYLAVCGMNTVLGPTLQAFGYSMLCSLNSIIFVLCFRVVWMAFIYPQYLTYNCLIACFLTSWILVMLTNIIMCAIVFLRYRKGLYKRL